MPGLEPRALPSKVAPRRLPAAFPRARLFAWLDACQPSPLIWVQGPAGSGKTTLVSSYVDTRGLPCVWYRADSSDTDPAVCFSLLAQAVHACTHGNPLPTLAPEIMPELPAFSGRFVRAMFDALPPDAVVLFDEMEASGGDALHAVLRLACEETRGRQMVLVTSRQPPPQALMHLRVKGSMRLLDWAEMKLAPDEARAIAEMRAPQVAVDRCDQLRGLCDGWVAGYVALLDAERRGAGAAASAQAVDQEIFPYFLNEVFARADPVVRTVLLKTSVLDVFTATDAHELCGASHQDLDRLCRESGFVERSATAPPSYRAHPLFAAFLRERLGREHSAEEVNELHLRAGRLLMRRGEHDAALSLLCAAGAWPEAVTNVCAAAPTWIAEGRHITLERALARLPPHLADDFPWLRQWQAMAWLPSSPHRAQAEFEAAFAAFEATHDAAGVVSACSGVLEATMLHWGDLRHLDLWGDRLRDLLDRHGDQLPPAVANRAWGSVSALLMRGPRHTDLAERALVRALDLLPTTDDAATRFGAALRALNLLKYRFRWSRACALWLEVQAWLPVDRVPPLQLVMWYSSGGAVAFWGGDFDAARERLTASLRLAEANNIRVLDVVNSNMLLQLELTQGRLAEAEAHLGRAAAGLQPHRVIDLASYDFMRAIWALSQGRVAEAQGAAWRCLENNEGCGSGPFVAQTRVVLASIQILSGEFDAARATAGLVLDYAQRALVDALRHSGLLLLAWAEFRAGRSMAALAALRDALALAREQGLSVVFPWVPIAMLQDLGLLALEHAIEPEAMTAMLRLREIPPPPHAPPEWPWRVQVRCFGTFEISIGGQLLELGSKVPKRPLDLLRALISMGSKSVPVGHLLHAVWPDLDGDAAQNAFGVALHRLRRLLGDERALIVRDGQVSIDAERVWVDVVALRRQAEISDECQLNHVDAERIIDRLQAVYRGRFLATSDAPWAEPCRVSSSDRYARICIRIGERLEAMQRFDVAVRLYSGATEREPTVEVLVRALMRCLALSGRKDEVVEAYRRCADALRRVSGVLPAESTRVLLRQLIDR